MTKKTLTALLLFSVIFMHAQKSVVPTGGNATGRGGTSSYTIGQIAFNSNTANNGSSSEGVQHAYDIIEVESRETVIKSDLVFTVYPNPSNDLVNIQIENYDKGVMSYHLISASGQLVLSKNSAESLTTISMGNLAQGIYFIKVSCDEKPIKTFKIIKN
jgi:hypothetical protein